MATERLRLPELNRGKQTAQVNAPTDQQSRNLLIALALLLVVLAFVVMRNREFWFGTDEVVDADSAGTESISNSRPAVAPVNAAQTAPVHSANVKSQHAQKTSVQLANAKPVQQDATDPEQPVVATDRVALPPLDVEVVAGDKHSTLRPGSDIAIAEIEGDSNRAALTASPASLSTNAAAREPLAVAGAPELRQAIDATYPLLGQHSRVQGSVVLEAVIGADGAIEGLRVLSGPSILSTAAQQAVRQWRFKPYLQNGQPVETKCRVTVNFSIRISDNSTKAS
jgi:TonB family protein